MKKQFLQATGLDKVALCVFGILGTIGVVANLVTPHQLDVRRSPELLRVQREDATKQVLSRLLRDPDSAEFTFAERGPNILRVRVRAQNAFGAFFVQTFDISFEAESVVASDVKEMD